MKEELEYRNLCNWASKPMRQAPALSLPSTDPPIRRRASTAQRVPSGSVPLGRADHRLSLKRSIVHALPLCRARSQELSGCPRSATRLRVVLGRGETITESTARASAITPILDGLYRYFSRDFNGRVEPCDPGAEVPFDGFHSAQEDRLKKAFKTPVWEVCHARRTREQHAPSNYKR